MTRSRRPIVVPGLCALVVAACGSTGVGGTFAPVAGGATPPPRATGSSGVTAPSAPGLVVVIVMENHSLDQVIGQPYLARLASQGAVLTDYHAVAHPSLPNYLALTSGSTWGITDDGYHPLPAGHDLGAQLSAAGVSWKAYMEGMTRGCRDSPSPYAVKHNPFAYYGGACPSNVVPFTRLAIDETDGSLPRFVWITPNLCDDDHDCPPSHGDTWLRNEVPPLLAQPAFARHGLLIVVWDEGGDNYDVSAAVVVSPDTRAGSSSPVWCNHYSLLGAIEDRLGLSRLGAAAQATPPRDVLAGP